MEEEGWRRDQAGWKEDKGRMQYGGRRLKEEKRKEKRGERKEGAVHLGAGFPWPGCEAVEHNKGPLAPGV